MPSKVANNRLGWAVFNTANQQKTSLNLKFCSKKLFIAQFIYIMTLMTPNKKVVCTLKF